MLFFGVLVICAFYLLYLQVRYKTRGSETVTIFPKKWPIIGHFYFYTTLKDMFDIVEKTGRYAIANDDVCKIYFMSHPGYAGLYKLKVNSLTKSKARMNWFNRVVTNFTESQREVAVCCCVPYVITDPEDASTVMHKCLKKMFLYKLIKPLFGSQLVSAEVAVWKRNRRIVDMAFKPHILDGYIEYFNSQAEQLVHLFAKEVGKGDIDLTNIVIRNVLETTRHTTMGNYNDVSVIEEEYVKAIHTVFKMIPSRIFRPWLLIDFIFNWTRDGRQFNNALNTVFQYSTRMVKLRKGEYINRLKTTEDSKTIGTKFKSYLDILLETSAGPNGFLFTDEEYRDLVDNILLAAFDTTTFELIFILVCIGTYPDVQEKIYQEIISILGDEEHVTKDHLQRFVYLEAAIKEALRLYPIGPIIARQTDTDVKLNNITVPSGSSVIINVYAINRHKKHWGPDAEDYKPDRWLDSATPSHLAAYCSFAPGKRNCVGKYYAMIYLKSTLIPILRKFKLTSDHKKMKLNWYLMLKPISGHFIKLDLRY